jgi:DNA-directed RNA polymerase subunit RPC12/RpoP
MTTAANRVQVLNVPLMAPGVCMLCGTAGIDNRTFVDFGKQVEWYGAVYLCSECIKEVAIAVGFIPVAEFDKLLEQLKEIEA